MPLAETISIMPASEQHQHRILELVEMLRPGERTDITSVTAEPISASTFMNRAKGSDEGAAVGIACPWKRSPGAGGHQ
jgi:hypothetical protein